MRHEAGPLRLALIGCGAIGAAVLERLRGDADVVVAAIVVNDTARAQAVAGRLAPGALVSTTVPAQGIDLVVEAAGHAAIEQHVVPALARGLPAIVASVGALSQPGLPERLEAAARTGRTQVQLIAGAIGAIDALAAAGIGGLHEVRYTGTKAANAWKGTPAALAHDLDALTSATVLFEGTAREAAALYPKNANVAATVSLAGLGLDRTRVRLVADPLATENVHRLEVVGAFGRLDISVQNQPLAANPKTSALTVYSLLRALRQHVAPVLI